jgi:Fur family transcriptional regulator, peroxide stress response regulator
MDTQARLDQLTTTLKARGYRLTPQRVAVLRVLAESQEHLCVEQIYDQVKAAFPMTSLATIYKTVTLLKEMGEVLELDFGGDSHRYDSRRPRPHPHLICTECKRLVDLDIPSFDRLVQEVLTATGYQVEGYRLDVFGVCLQCRSKS